MNSAISFNSQKSSNILSLINVMLVSFYGSISDDTSVFSMHRERFYLLKFALFLLFNTIKFLSEQSQTIIIYICNSACCVWVLLSSYTLHRQTPYFKILVRVTMEHYSHFRLVHNHVYIGGANICFCLKCFP